MAVAKVYLEYFPFFLFHLLGGTHLVLGAILLGLGIGDAAHTNKYYGRNSDCDVNFPESVLIDADYETPCENEVLKIAYVSAPIWSGIVLILLGVIASRLDINSHPSNTDTWRERFMYGSLACFAVLLPITFGLAIAEFVMGHKVFYAITQPGAVHGMLDGVKFAVPIVVIIIAIFAFITSLYSAYLAYTNPIDIDAEILEESDDDSDSAYTKGGSLEEPYFVSPKESPYDYATYGGRRDLPDLGYGGPPPLRALGYY